MNGCFDDDVSRPEDRDVRTAAAETPPLARPVGAGGPPRHEEASPWPSACPYFRGVRGEPCLRCGWAYAVHVDRERFGA